MVWEIAPLESSFVVAAAPAPTGPIASFSMENPYPNPNLSNTERFLEALVDTLLSAPDLTVPSQISRVLEEALHRRPDAEKVDLLKRSALLGTNLQDAAFRLWRQHDASCNSSIWPLTHDLTIKVFSLLGVHSLSQAAASCSLFNKAAMEPVCYRDIDLTDKNLRVDNKTVEKLIDRAGPHLRSLKLGSPAAQDKESHGLAIFGDAWRAVNGNMFLTKSCLEPLLLSGGAAGALLQTLHLQNIDELDSRSICKVIAACPGLLDLEIVGLHVNERKVMRSVTSCCHKLTRLSLQSPKTESAKSWISYSMRSLPCSAIVRGCPNISSLSLRGFKLPDHKVKLLLKGLHHLSEVDFSGADLLTGSFLRDLVVSEDQKLKSLKLCDCLSLRAVEVNRLLSSLSTGECENLRFLDVSNKDGLVSSDWTYPRANLNEDIVLLVRLERPELDLRADFSDEKSSSDCDSMSLASSFGYSEYTEPIRVSCHSDIFLSEGTDSLRSSSSNDTEQDSEDEDEGEEEEEEDDDDEGDDDDDEGNDAEDVEFDLDVESNDLNEKEGEDEDTEFLSPCYSSEDENLLRSQFG